MIPPIGDTEIETTPPMYTGSTSWEDEFNEPDLPSLLSILDEELTQCLGHITDILDQHGAVHSLSWYGISWKWCIEYRLPKSEDLILVIITAPEDLQIAMPITDAFLKTLPTKNMKRSVRDGLELGSPPYQTTWASWSINPAYLLDEYEDLIKRRVRFLKPDKD